MTGILVLTNEDERPWHVGHLSDNLGVHQVAQSDEGGCDARADSHVVENHPTAHLGVAAIEPDADEHSYHTAVARQSLIARKLPTAVGHMVHRYQHLDEMIPLREEVFWLIKDAMSQSATNQHTEEDVQKKGRELFVRHLLLLVELAHEQITQKQAYHPASGIIADGQRTQVSQDWTWVPDDIVEQICHHNRCLI